MIEILSDDFLVNMVGVINKGHKILEVEKRKDSHRYGVALGVSEESGNFVVWQFHKVEGRQVDFYWGHYFSKGNKELADKDFQRRREG